MTTQSFLVIVHPYPPTPSSGAHRWGAIVKYLRRAGHDVRVVTSGAFGALDPEQERGVTRTADLMASARLRRLAGIAPLAAPDGRAGPGAGADPELPAVLTRVLVPDAFLASWAPMALRAAWRSLRERPADCVITSSPNESTHLVGLALRRRLGHAWIADLRDGWTFERFLPEFPTAAQRSLNRALERRALTGADAVMAATEPIAADLRGRLGIDVAHVPNAWDPDLDAGIAPPEPHDGAGVELVHTGKLSGGWGRDPRPLLHGLRRVLDEQPGRLRLKLAGRLDEEDARLIAEAGLGDAVEHVGQLGRAEAVRLQRGAGVLLLVTSRHSGEATGKLFEYLSSGRPILAVGGMNEAARIVTETGTGVAVDSRDEEAVAAALRTAASGRLPYAPRGLERYRYPWPAERVSELAEVAAARRGR
ncbi:MAG: glycosyltransferase [Thermoleophilaceae bacterium]|nr:glycosyltransferase [Thermoleophilaceae bacterium]